MRHVFPDLGIMNKILSESQVQPEVIHNSNNNTINNNINYKSV